MLGPFSRAAGIPIPLKTIVAIRAEVYTLLQTACWVLKPKPHPAAAFFITPNGADARPAGRCEHTFFPAGQVSRFQRP